MQDEFLALASHELRTPLTAARSALQLVVGNSNGSADQQTIQRWAGIALRQVERLTQLVSDLMDVGRLQTGHLNLHMQPVSLGDVVTQAVEAARLLAPEQPIELSIAEKPLIVAGDPVRIEQIVTNLLNNAVKYAPQSPQIKVRLRQVGGHAELQVEDAGPGIAPEKLPRLFSRYYQAEEGEQRSQSGLGLGLFLTKELVTAHGGTVDVVSRENAGTTFTITLPLGA